ncbi:hypothetical protein C0T31_07080 [Dysgonamonadaceae bacterium]|nr:hypothetical protein C0T31_07080 [Dysgonamonadaceae bacterium]
MIAKLNILFIIYDFSSKKFSKACFQKTKIKVSFRLTTSNQWKIFTKKAFRCFETLLEDSFSDKIS